ncbi:hypothetical protein D3C84_757140 [compost metagenome]
MLAWGQGQFDLGLRLAEVQYLRTGWQRRLVFRQQAGRQYLISGRLLVDIYQQVVVAGVRGLVTRWLELHALDTEFDGEGLVDRRAIGRGNDEDLGVFRRLLALQAFGGCSKRRNPHQQANDGCTRN